MLRFATTSTGYMPQLQDVAHVTTMHTPPPSTLCYIATTANELVHIGSTYALKSGSPPPSLAAANARFGSTRTRLTKSPTPILVKPSASSYQMASSSANKSLCTRVPVPGSLLLRDVLGDTVGLVRERVLRTLGCLGMFTMSIRSLEQSFSIG